MVAEMRKANEATWRRQRDRDKEVMQLLANEHSVIVPDTMNRLRKFKVEPEVMKSGMLSWVSLRASAFYPVPAVMSVVSRSGPVAESRAEKVNDWLNEWLDQSQEDAGEDVWQLLVRNGIEISRCVDIVLSGEGYWWDFPTDLPDDVDKRNEVLKAWLGAAPVPVVWRHIPAETAFPPSLGQLNDEVLAEQTLTLAEVAAHFGQTEAVEALKTRLQPGGLFQRGGSEAQLMQRKVSLLTYANRQWIVWVAQPESGKADTGEMLQAYQHGMGICPIRITPTFTTPRKEAGRYWQSPLMECVDIVKTLDKRLSEWATHSRLAGMGPWVFSLFDRGQGRSDVEDVIQGDAIVLRKDDKGSETVQPMSPPGQSEMIGQLVQLTISLIERKTGITPVLSGHGIEREAAAAAIKVSADLASELYEPASVNLTRHSKSVGERCLAAIAQFGETVSLTRAGMRAGEGRTLSLDPEEAKAWTVQVQAKLEPRFQMTRVADMGLYLQGEQQARASGKRPWGKSWAIRNLLRVEDVRAFRQEMLVDEWEDRPEIADFYTQDALRAAQVELQTKRTLSPQELLNMQAQGMFQGAPAIEQALVRRGRLPQRDNPYLPNEATMQSIHQTGRVPATIQTARTPQGLQG